MGAQSNDKRIKKLITKPQRKEKVRNQIVFFMFSYFRVFVIKIWLFWFRLVQIRGFSTSVLTMTGNVVMQRPLFICL
jgi:hypothetical protein